MELFECKTQNTLFGIKISPKDHTSVDNNHIYHKKLAIQDEHFIDIVNEMNGQ